MRDAIALFLLFPIICFIMFQPFMADVVHKRGVILESTAKKAIQLSAEDGYFSPRVQNIIKQDLQNLHWDTSKLTMSPTSGTPVLRGQDVTITLKYPVGQIYIFTNFFSADNTSLQYNYTFTEKSEYLP
jgi:hypothetical protein